ncbi:MAG: DMT family transporter [Alphaproteobacteria bacterium]|nr:DMT family transporter [Alphaproteobacteria bacterium]
MLSNSLALAAAFCIALSSMFVAALNNRLPLLQLARWQLGAAFVMTALAATVTGGWASLGQKQIEELAASGFFGIVFASTTYFATIFKAGPRLTALLFSLTSPFALALAYGAYGETIQAWQGLGIAYVLIGILVAVALPGHMSAQQGASEPKASSLGIALGVVTAFGQALGSLFARPAMASGVDPFAAMAVRIGVAVVIFWAAAALPALRRRDVAISRREFGLIFTSAFFGTGLGMVLLMAALKSGNVGIVSTLSSMTPIVILPMVWVRTGRRPGMAAWAGAFIAIMGTALISLNSTPH